MHKHAATTTAKAKAGFDKSYVLLSAMGKKKKRKEKPTDCTDSGKLRRKKPLRDSQQDHAHRAVCVCVCARTPARVYREKSELNIEVL